MIELSDKTKKILKIVGICSFIIYIYFLCFTWSIQINFDAAPDEKMKYDICRYLYKNNKLPHGGDESIRDSKWGISYAFTPILSYMISAVFMKITSFFTQNFNYIFISARLVSVLCITGYAIITTKIASKLFKGIYKWLYIIFATLLPQIIFLGSYLNNDALALFSISIIVYSWILGIESNWSWKSCIIMAIGIGICALSYYNAYGYILCSIIIYFASCYIKKIKVKEFFKKGIVIFLIAFSIAGWWFIRNYIIYDGDFLGLNISNEYAEKYAIKYLKPSNRKTPANKNFSLIYMLFNMNWIKLTNNSFIGIFGYMNVKMQPILYNCYNIIFLVGIIGIIIANLLKTKNKNDEKISQAEKNKKHEKTLFYIIMVISIIIPIVLSLYYSYYSDFQPQGRYIMGIILPLMYFIVLGFKFLFEKIVKNDEVRNIVLTAIIVFIIIIPIYIYYRYIAFYL